MKTSAEIRQDFLDFFREKKHQIVKSAPVIPPDDPTLLFTNAGMNQFKSYFLNLEEPQYRRVADTQKCIRVSGKHNDLEEVGQDTYHHTFFEMLGNWSFGDYYKREAIQYAWELVTDVWQFPKERLWVTVYQDDEEAERLWKEVTDIMPARILRFGEKDNFWEMGETGPCGPCSEIHYYTGQTPQKQQAGRINAEDPEYIELWNLVFIQYNRDEAGKTEPLPKKHVDTGAGLERIVAALQGVTSNYDTDLFKPIIARIADMSGVAYSGDDGAAHRVIADHVRMLTFAIADGGMPSNEGRGYVIRRILRRAARFGRMLNMHNPFIYELVDMVGDILGEFYPEIIEHRQHIRRVIHSEEQFFGETLDRGLEVYNRIKARMERSGKKQISGKDAFRLYDTYGFPLDLTQLIAADDGYSVDLQGFQDEMKKQRERARAAMDFRLDSDKEEIEWVVLTKGEETEFVGYEKTAIDATVRRYFVKGDKIHLTLDRTPFYAEAGGEVGDKGRIQNSEYSVEVENTIRFNNSILHIGTLEGQMPLKMPQVRAIVNRDFDRSVRANHTATHLLQAALRQVLGEHVHQSGSLVTPARLRFDFTHYEKVSTAQLHQVEDIVNRKIRENQPVGIAFQDYDSAKKAGAMALFGEKYEDEVRVVKVADFSRELCGGKHARRTGDLGFFKIISETSVATGIRRIEAVTGQHAVKYVRDDEAILAQAIDAIGIDKKALPQRLIEVKKEVKRLEKSLSRQQTVDIESIVKNEIEQSPRIGSLKVFTQQYEVESLEELKKIGDVVRGQLGNGVGLLSAVIEDKPMIVVVVSDDVIRQHGLKAGDIVKELGKILGGGGGGRSHMATAGGKLGKKLPDVVKKFRELIEEITNSTA